jgi:hypothetical protein
MTPWSPPDWPMLWPIFTIQPRVQGKHSSIVHVLYHVVYVGYLDCFPASATCGAVHADLAILQFNASCSWASVPCFSFFGDKNPIYEPRCLRNIALTKLRS